MDVVIARLHATAPQPLSFAPEMGVRSFLLERDGGNLLLYNSDTVVQEADHVREVGGIWRRYMNHGHEAGAAQEACTRAASTCGAPLYVHEDEEEEVSGVCEVGGTFRERHTVGDDFEVVPIPGHTGGATAFLWDTGELRVLFTGDSVKLEGDEWAAVLLDPDARDEYAKSLELIRGLDFDLIAPWAASLDGSYYAFTDREDTRRRIGGLLDRMRSG
jgi:glyoxylase-like metal-dependent hydrolase (beta-lactamase superfamily II)